MAIPCMCASMASACTGNGVLSPRGPVADANRAIMFNSLAIMLAIVIPTIAGLLGVAWWFREGNARAHQKPRFIYSGRIEAIVWGIPFLTIVFLSGLIWIGSHQLDPARPVSSAQKQLEVQVVSLDWKWLFIYPEEHIATVNKLVLPVGRPVHFSLTSASVMNAFFVPQLGSQMYAMNGMRTDLNLLASKPGTYRGRSAHFSGDGFARMDFNVEALPPSEFSRWMTSVQGSAGQLDRKAYSVLARQSENDPPRSFGAVEAGLFDAIAEQRIPPAAGPRQALRSRSDVVPEGGR